MFFKWREKKEKKKKAESRTFGSLISDGKTVECYTTPVKTWKCAKTALEGVILQIYASQ